MEISDIDITLPIISISEILIFLIRYGIPRTQHHPSRHKALSVRVVTSATRTRTIHVMILGTSVWMSCQRRTMNARMITSRGWTRMMIFIRPVLRVIWGQNLR
uniref:Uncharacterized protein n=1 Tax=Cacopsylla melanoneura TaxID=428564 RepID=A0A8D8TC68_9HEMI